MFSKIKGYCVMLLGLFSLFLLGRNSRLSKQNQRLNSNLQGQKQTIEKQTIVV